MLSYKFLKKLEKWRIKECRRRYKIVPFHNSFDLLMLVKLLLFLDVGKKVVTLRNNSRFAVINDDNLVIIIDVEKKKVEIYKDWLFKLK